jgi:DNA-binding MurR/RpiR family transcriptional regulator
MANPNQNDVSLETFETLRSRIRERYDDLSPHLQRIARASLDEPNAFALKTIATISGEVGVQPSTLIRFAKEFGYPGFSDLQKVFRLRLIEGAAPVREKVFSEAESRPAQADLVEILDRCVEAHIQALQDLRKSVPRKTLAEAVYLLRGARHIYVAGLRRSRPIATYLAYGLIRSERQCSLIDFGGGMAGQQAANMGADDVLVAIAFPPYSQPVVDLVADVALSGRRILAITDSRDSPLARHATGSFHIGASAKSQFQPISAAIGLVQALVTAVGQAPPKGTASDR